MCGRKTGREEGRQGVGRDREWGRLDLMLRGEGSDVPLNRWIDGRVFGWITRRTGG